MSDLSIRWLAAGEAELLRQINRMECVDGTYRMAHGELQLLEQDSLIQSWGTRSSLHLSLEYEGSSWTRASHWGLSMNELWWVWRLSTIASSVRRDD